MQAGQRAFELADVGADVGRDEERDVGGQRALLALGLLLQDGDLGFEIGRLNVGDQAPLEARAQAVFEIGEFLGRAVGGDDDLLDALVQRVEGVEELFLRALLAGEELDVVDEQHVDACGTCRGSWSSCRCGRGDHLVGELLAET